MAHPRSDPSWLLSASRLRQTEPPVVGVQQQAQQKEPPGLCQQTTAGCLFPTGKGWQTFTAYVHILAFAFIASTPSKRGPSSLFLASFIKVTSPFFFGLASLPAQPAILEAVEEEVPVHLGPQQLHVDEHQQRLKSVCFIEGQRYWKSPCARTVDQTTDLGSLVIVVAVARSVINLYSLGSFQLGFICTRATIRDVCL